MLIKKLRAISELFLSGYEPAEFEIEIGADFKVSIACRYSQVEISILDKVFYQTVTVAKKTIKKDNFSFEFLIDSILLVINLANEKEKKNYDLRVKNLSVMHEAVLDIKLIDSKNQKGV